ncbi:hypothetical protein R20233_00021 [Ralstonia sp. LMG 32965]|nr:hypothetical protein R20233_00021 [Ralstonia sp. LMG 32965]
MDMPSQQMVLPRHIVDATFCHHDSQGTRRCGSVK